MALVDYSGSESSDEGEKFIAKQATKLKTTSNEPAFQKVVDRSEPHKIWVSLPEVSKPTPEDRESERPTKRAKIGSGGTSGFNALLPAPKRATAANSGASLAGMRKAGLGSGVNLRTGAAPGFSREPELSLPSTEEDHTEGNEAMPGVRAEEHIAKVSAATEPALLNAKPLEEPKPKGTSTMFKPLSVARKPQKRKATPLGPGGMLSEAPEPQKPKKPAQKISLFSTGDTNQTSREESERKGAYQPMVYDNNLVDTPSSSHEVHGEFEADVNNISSLNIPIAEPTPQSLEIIASDLNLSKSAKRQLLGRQKNNASAINVVNFNTDEEYKANEDIRRSGEQVQHNAVRAIAPGKHSLKQLVNMGSMQAEALEESFASGRRNRSEAGSKYGW